MGSQPGKGPGISPRMACDFLTEARRRARCASLRLFLRSVRLAPSTRERKIVWFVGRYIWGMCVQGWWGDPFAQRCSVTDVGGYMAVPAGGVLLMLVFTRHSYQRSLLSVGALEQVTCSLQFSARRKCRIILNPYRVDLSLPACSFSQVAPRLFCCSQCRQVGGGHTSRPSFAKAGPGQTE